MGKFVQNVLKVCGCYSAEMLLELMSSFFKMHFWIQEGSLSFQKMLFQTPTKMLSLYV